MNLSEPFIRRPIATALLMAALLVGGIIGYNLLPVAALPSVDFPTISVTASLPGASPQIMASSVAQPLERQFAELPGVNQITSTNVQGTTSITLQFDLSRDIDGAAADVQAAINAASGLLPKQLPNPPTYKKVNPADQPVLILGLTSDVMNLHELDQYADLNLAQRISMLSEVGQVVIFGEQKYAPTIQLNPAALAARKVALDDVATALSNNTVELPVGTLQGAQQAYQIGANSQLLKVNQLDKVIVAYRNGAPVRVKDVGRVVDGSDAPLQLDWVNNHIGEMIGIWRQPGSNTLELVDRVKKMLPQLQAGIPPSVKLTMVSDRSLSISASFTDVKLTLGFTIALVVLVIFAFLRSFWATVIPSITVPLALVGTFAVLYLGGYSLDNLSLMALTLAVGLVVDDAIVMLENIYRYLEKGDDALTAALKGSSEIGFTIVSISISLIAVFIPLLFMSGIVGRLFREFGVTVAVAIVLSAIIALTLSPTMAALVLRDPRSVRHGRLYEWSERAFERTIRGYERALRLVLRFRFWAMLLNLALIALTGWLVVTIPKGFFPDEDTGLIFGFTEASPSISFMGMADLQQRAAAVILKDPDVLTAGSAIGGGASSGINTGRLFISLKPWNKRKATEDQIIARLRPKLAQVPGITTYLQPVQSIQIGGRLSRTQYQYTLQDINMQELQEWAPKVEARMKSIGGLEDVASDLEQTSPQLTIRINRDLAARLGISPSAIETTLYDAFGQRYVTELYAPLNTYHVVMEVMPAYQQDVSALSHLYVEGSGGPVPISQFADLAPTTTTVAVNHQGQFPAVTLSFNLAPKFSLGDAVNAINRATQEIGLPRTVLTSFQGTAQAFQASLTTQPLLIAAAIFAVYVVLGILYESFIHPITILMSLPPASVGALLCLELFGFDLSVIAIIGLIMLIGIVKKNAIMMIDFALERVRQEHKSAEEAIYEAAVMRFRPIMMTTMAAILGTLPIALGIGAGAELRQPLGVAVVGGLVVSQALTLFTIPVTYLYMEEFSEWLGGFRRRRRGRPSDLPAGRALVPAGNHPLPALIDKHAAE
ncbi:MAG TPA: efflux RND transporter permease subunit [Stellaceae bacterium]|jgi:hydrophobe/amphiphile efflux-1 (HAE1) family protein|nr:efflux RND transporter permease subunit [Stellaceae bacterium]